MLAQTITSKFIRFLVKIRILQNDTRIVDYAFTIIWTLLGMVVPISMIIFTRNNIIAGLTSRDLTNVILYSKTLVGQINLVLLVPIICSVGVLNQDLAKATYLLRPTRSYLWVFCLFEICFAVIQYTVKNIKALEKACSVNDQVCVMTTIFMMVAFQFAILRSLTITLVGISSKQVITAIESQDISIQTVQKNILLFKKMKKSLSAILFVGLSYEILACIASSYNLIYGTIDIIEALIQSLFSFSMVFYYCLSLDDCFVAFKAYIFVVR